MNQNAEVHLMGKKRSIDLDDVEEGEITDDEETPVVVSKGDLEGEIDIRGGDCLIRELSDGALTRLKRVPEQKLEIRRDDRTLKSASNISTTDSPSRKRHLYSPKRDSHSPKRSHWLNDSPREDIPPIPRLCKFFREGYCRDGETCSFSHDARYSKRKPEICKFFQEGHCRKGLQCDLFHGEFPCKLFHQGKCTNYICKYSHEPFNDFTRQIYERMMQDETLASQIIIPQGSIKRKVLLPKPKIPPITSQQVSVDSWREESEKPIAESWRDDPDEMFVSSLKKPLLPKPTSIVAVDTWREDPDELFVVKEAAIQQLLFEKIGVKEKNEQESWRESTDNQKFVENPPATATASQSWKKEKEVSQKSQSSPSNPKVENLETPKSSLFSNSVPEFRENKFSFNEILEQMSNINTPENYNQTTSTTKPESISDLII